jgi:aspartyl-tRNA(Asn)/glutamyl-tRNA(Gln) amidotransferase subunit C
MSALIDESEVRRIAKLARLNLCDDEVRLFAGQLANILDYVRQIEALDTKGVEPTAPATGMTNVLREDEPRDGLSHQQALANAPETQEGCFRVPAVIDPHGEA